MSITQLAAEWVAEHAENEPLAHALAVALAAIDGWGDFTADDFEEFMQAELPRQQEMAEEDE